MPRSTLLMATAVASAAAMPLAMGEHGQALSGNAEMDDGTDILVAGQYLRGTGNDQFWQLDVMDEDGTPYDCIATGSIETGLTAYACAKTLVLGGTGHEHAPFAPPAYDAHDVTLRWGNVNGTLHMNVIG